MRTTVNIDDELLARKPQATGPAGKYAAPIEGRAAPSPGECGLILVDASVWVDHLRSGDGQPVKLLERASLIMHPLLAGEIACESLRNRASLLELLQDLPAAAVAESGEVLGLLERHFLHGQGIGYVDVHLLASVALTEGARLWTRDKRLRVVAQAMGCAFQDSPAH